MDITRDPIPKLIRAIAVPAAMGFFFNTMFNVVDTYYTRFISTEALAGLSLSFPVFFILVAFSHGLGSGIQGLASNALGKKDSDGADRLAYAGIILAILFSILLAVFGIFASVPAFSFMGAQGQSLEEGVVYIRVIMSGLPFFFLNNGINGLLSATGDTKAFRNFLILGFFLNLALDPLFIIAFDMGTAGLALATVVVQAVGTVYLWVRLRRTGSISFSRGQKKGHPVTLWPSLLHQSLPASLNSMSIALGVFIINRFIVQFGGDEAIAGYGAAIRIEQIILLPTIGLNMALVTLAGQNHGANQPERVREAYNKTVLYGLAIMGTGMVLLLFLRRPLVAVFNPVEAVIAAGAGYLLIEIVAMPAYVLLGTGNSLLQGLKKPGLIFWVGLFRQIIFPPILFYLLGTVSGLGLQGVWWGIVISVWGGALLMFFRARLMISSSDSNI
ncbi:MATE family efflux transporter [Spirochaeta isovalerica]|uniref:Putative MATE family efflux protein n=1 Tax=Spirochaeta isovalerica TaxID=150 RepID=A0A841R9H3_9SPIO|nr:MATE family efflux transporter [Spirochaeta isovalerica]MBB6480011.1 putative MATE family efflux protein [Spirochaeta isovalerica]